MKKSWPNTRLHPLFVLAFIFLFAFVSCLKDVDSPDPEPSYGIESLIVPDGFHFETSRDVDFSIQVLANNDKPIPNVRLSILSDFRENGGQLLGSGVTDSNGKFTRQHSVPAYYERIVIAASYVGLLPEVEFEIINGKVSGSIGGSQDVVTAYSDASGKSDPIFIGDMVFLPMGGFNPQGVPEYLEPENDIIDADFLNDINASFPEGQAVPVHNPHYLDPSNEYDFLLTEAADVWVTFVHEGANYRNVFAYYTYPVGSPPSATSEIDTIHIVFPNVSYQGSGGGLHTGNKVYLGQFPAHTAIGWVLIANGFQHGTGNISGGQNIFFSNPDLNPEQTPANRYHAIHLSDNIRDLFLLGFEDMFRDNWSDDDFNDAMFLVTANPVESVDASGYQAVVYDAEDADGDGIPDYADDYPDDPLRAFNNYYPSEEGWGSLAFEDLWPSVGDYDFNDLVVDYRINQVTNASGNVVEILALFRLRALGASFKNGFGFELPLGPGDIASVSGQDLREGIISLNANNTEAGQSNAVIILFDNGFNILQHPGGGTGINTDPDAPYVEPVTMELTISLTTPLPLSQVGTPPYNPFIFTNLRRGHEIHLPGMPPTDLVDESLIGTFDDSTNPLTGRFYKTHLNLPWAIHVIEEFDYPTEKAEITDGHLRMGDWAQSNGNQYPDWFKDKPNYRNPHYIFNP